MTISRTITVDVTTPEYTRTSKVCLEYSKEDPFAVRFIANQHSDTNRAVWEFARSLLGDVLAEPVVPDPSGYVIGRAGLDTADIHFRAYSDETVDMYLSSPEGLATVRFRRSAIALFLHATSSEWIEAIQEPNLIEAELDAWLERIHD